jgi:hypothetical protein
MFYITLLLYYLCVLCDRKIRCGGGGGVWLVRYDVLLYV